jgi:hypothetical protein
MIASAVYILCALTSAACAGLLFRGYNKSRVRLLWWSAVCFAGLSVGNVFLFIDLVLFPDETLLAITLLRYLPSLLGMSALVYGLVWEDV